MSFGVNVYLILRKLINKKNSCSLCYTPFIVSWSFLAVSHCWFVHPPRFYYSAELFVVFSSTQDQVCPNSNSFINTATMVQPYTKFTLRFVQNIWLQWCVVSVAPVRVCSKPSSTMYSHHQLYASSISM